MPDGRKLHTWNKEFEVNDPTNSFSTKTEVPEHLEKKEFPFSEKYKDFETFMDKWAGYKKDKKTGRYGYWENPNKKWDWYVLGGRWSGMLINKNGEHSDQEIKKDIDLEKMLNNSRDRAYKSYEEFLKEENKSAYFIYGVKNKGDKDNFIPETLEEYVARNTNFSTFAVVKDGKWYEKGEMGWWACVSNEKGEDEWEAQFVKLLDETPDDTLISIFDCHI
jgi:hypothetical protein